jgi:hypothetical protein
LEVAFMKSKLFVVGACVLVSSAWWMGCSSSSSGTATAVDGGGTGSEGGNIEAGGGTETGTDAGTDSSTGLVITGPFIDIQYKSCAAFTACGGDVKGLWRLTGGCVDEGAFAAAKAQCPGIVESNVKFQARGVVSADATTITRKTEVKFTATLAVPVECKNANPLGTTCKAAEAAVQFAGIKTATCTDAAAGGGCDCNVGDSTSDDTTDTYSTAGNTLTSGVRTFDYCVAGSDLTYKETTAKAIPAVYTLAK